MKPKRKINKPKAAPVDPTFETMRTWFDTKGEPADKDRREGMEAFAAKIKGNLQEIADCERPDHARRRFSQWGHFYIEGEEPDPSWNFPPFGSDPTIKPIPKDTEFRVYGRREHRPERDKTVVLVVDNGKEGEPTNGVWRCTYSPYLDLFTSKDNKRARAKKRPR